MQDDEEATYQENVTQLQQHSSKEKPRKKVIKNLMNSTFSCKYVGCSAILWAYLT